MPKKKPDEQENTSSGTETGAGASQVWGAWLTDKLNGGQGQMAQMLPMLKMLDGSKSKGMDLFNLQIKMWAWALETSFDYAASLHEVMDRASLRLHNLESGADWSLDDDRDEGGEW